MLIGKVHHMGYLVKNIKKSLESFTALGYQVETEFFYDEERRANFCFMKNQNACVELVEPCEESDIFPLLKKYNNTIYHVCYEVEDIDNAIEQLKTNGFLLFRDKQKAPAISDRAEVVFLMHARMGIIELVQEKQ